MDSEEGETWEFRESRLRRDGSGTRGSKMETLAQHIGSLRDANKHRKRKREGLVGVATDRSNIWMKVVSMALIYIQDSDEAKSTAPGLC